tara:strand:+ start:1768 stop:1905 length:138 start_codon:yes stop_codon:yes gene_type:complete
MNYINELSYDKIINEIAEYITNNKIKIKKRTLKRENNKSKKNKNK